MAIRAVLFDCDGVLQEPARDWVITLSEVGGPDFPWALFDAEVPALRGEVSLLSVLEELARTWALTATPAQLLPLWSQIRVDQSAWRVVDDVRALGLVVALATNQQDYRMPVMRDQLGYDARVDRAYYSCELGICKPDPAFFETILADLDLPAEQVLFIDDAERNVVAASALGLNVIQHDPASGAAALQREIRHYVPAL